jgi:peptidoglycan L-alanyl-D-glutamate endopeptidase CwlK
VPGKIVTKAKGGKSWHNYGLAVDCAIMYDKDQNGTFEFLSWDEIADANHDGEADWMEMVDAFKSEGFEWGGDWKTMKDEPHFEMRFGMPENCSTAYQKYLNHDFIEGTTYINI